LRLGDSDGDESGWPWPSQRGFSRTAKFEKAAQDFHRIRFELFCYGLWEVYDPPVEALQNCREWRPPPVAGLAQRRGPSSIRRALSVCRRAPGLENAHATSRGDPPTIDDKS
jgi:hypothetical protein